MTVEFHASKVSMRAIGSLKPYEKNNRKHPPAQVSALAKIIADGGWTQPIVIDEDNVILSGHGRLLAAKELKLAKVPCVTATGLSEAQKRAMRISDNQSGLMGGADWDLDNLKFEIDALKIDDFDLDLTGFDDGFLSELFVEENEKNNETYTHKIQAPIYQPIGDKPAISELSETSKTKSLQAEILAANLPKDITTFLLSASERHTVFDFRNIAEFYAHADTNVQRLMENSALVVIDFNKAIENGFVNLTGNIGSLVNLEGSNEG